MDKALSHTMLVLKHTTEAEKKEIFQINITGLNVSTGGRQTSWLFTSMTKELNWGLPRNNSS